MIEIYEEEESKETNNLQDQLH